MSGIKLTQVKSQDGRHRRTIVASEPWRGAWNDHRSLIATYFEQAGLDMPERAIGLIDEECFVAVYDLQHRLLFASGNFLETVSFPLEELRNRSWQELYDNIDTRMNDIAADIVAGKISEVVDLSHIPVHLGKEVGSKLLVKAHFAPHFMAPMHDAAGELAGYMISGYLTREV